MTKERANKMVKERNFVGKNHPMWKGGLPRCEVCSKKLRSYKASLCVNHKGIKTTGRKNKMWKGDQVEYHGLHQWIGRKLGKPDTCEKCGKSGLEKQQIHWANISGKYLRNTKDWIRLCASCHKLFDSNLKKDE